jgi:signal transduction histidine kinase
VGASALYAQGTVEPEPSTRFHRLGIQPIDAALAVAVTALLQAELWLGERYQGAAAFPGARGLNAPLLLVAGLALGWRRRYPLRAFAVSMGALAIESVVSGGPEAGGAFLLLLVAVYSAAAYGDRPLATVAIAAGAVAVHDLTDPYIQGAGDVAFALIFAVVGFAFGRAVQGRRLRSSLLAEEASRLKAQHDERARQAVAEERARIARELHDIVAHSVSLMVVQAIAGQRASNGDGEAPAAREALASIETTGRQAMSEMRRLLALLHESDEGPIAPQPGLEQLPQLIAEVERAGAEISLIEHGERPALSPGVQLALYRIAQEALTNVLKHAGGARVDVELRYVGSDVELRVRDHGGAGIVGDGAWTGGTGIAGMRERAAVFGGELRAAPVGEGFAVELRLPVAGRAA